MQIKIYVTQNIRYMPTQPEYYYYIENKKYDNFNSASDCIEYIGNHFNILNVNYKDDNILSKDYEESEWSVEVERLND